MANPPSFFFPGEGFAFTRSYIASLIVRQDGSGADLTDNVIHFVLAGAPPANVYVTILDKFVPWSSNHFILKEVFLDAWYEVGGVEHHEAFPWDVGYLLEPGASRGSLYINIHYGAYNIATPLPYSPPADYWLPDPLA